MAQKGQHVVPASEGWAVRRSGSERASAVFATQDEAIQRGRELARAQGTELYIHGRDGRIRDWISFGERSFSMKG
ncbi:DUF2188 domain-containing protein [Rhodobacter capsulatus]|uniref:DUF2188 domain-containing protein n=1 Tax=Rhodobacter capsulatus TaxID=1061 RepID=UPI0003D31093|nr:DUF2188 domain-containing protein [Rhodobacter capsulatus]ETD87356.1 hypothetical protein U716_00535 [Rhodobacter capsulatus B6]